MAISVQGTSGGDNITGGDDAEFFWLGDGGNDHIWGGNGDDIFYFGSAFTNGDIIDGGDGNDMVILQGAYYGLNLQGAVPALSGIEMIVLMSAADTRFGASGTGTNYYDITVDDADLAAGQQMTIQGNRLGASEAIRFLGPYETDGSFRLIGGAGDDFFYGSANADMIYGGIGLDRLIGWGGDDVFVYLSTAESGGARGLDLISGLSAGDKIDLHSIDADTNTGGDQAFTFIGSDAFHNVAGELRASLSGNEWTVQADVNGDGVADFALTAIFATGQAGPLDASYFLL